MSDSQDGTPTVDPPDGTAVTSQIHTINISCAGCGEAYSVSDDDGLAGMSFPCDNCGTMVEVPEMPWVDQGGTTFETTSPAGMEFDAIPEEKALDGGTAINVTCFSCLEEYNVSADDGLAGMDFPCDNCGVDVKVPDHPWPEAEPTETADDDDFFNVGTPLSEEELAEREEQGHQQMSEGDLEGLSIPDEGPAIEGGTAITVMCFSCLEEYNVSADDGLAGIEFPCSNCGADVQVPDHPWPDTEPEPDYDDDFFNVGTPLTEEEQIARDDAKKIEDEELARQSDEAAEALAAKKHEAKAEPVPEKAPEKKPEKAPEKKAEKAPEKKKPKEKKPKKKAKPEPESKQGTAPEREPEPRAEPPRSEPQPMAAAPRPSSEAPRSPAGNQGGPRRPSVVSGGGRKLHARTRDPDATDPGAADTGPAVTVVHEKGPAAPRPPDSVPTVAAPIPRVPAPRAPMPAAAKAPERKRFREPDRPRLDMGSGGISAPSGNYAGGGGGGGGDSEPEAVTVTLKRGGRADVGPEPTQPTVEIQRGRNTGGSRTPKRPAPKSKGPIVVRVVSPFFSGMKKLFSRGSDTPEPQAMPIEQTSPGAAPSHLDNGSNVSPQEQARRRQVQIIHEQREDIRRGVGVRDAPGDEDLEESEDGDSAVDNDEEARKRKVRNIKLAVLTGLLIAPFVIWSDVLFAPLLGDKARPETDKKFWENREVGQEEESNQPTVDLSEMLGAKEEAKAEVKPISADNVDTLGYRNLRNQVDLLSVQGLQANKSLLLWAQFRLASAYKDPVARKQLIANAPKRLNSEEYGPMGLAAAAGALVIQGKGGKARKLINRLTVSEGKESPQMLLVLAMSQKPRGNADKIVAMLDDALAKNPSMMDARFARASILSPRTQKGEDWAPELVDAILESKDPDNAVRGGQLLLQQELFAEQARMFEPFKSVPALDAMSPERRDTFIKMLTGAHLHKADFENAYQASRARLEGKASTSAVVEAARLAEASGKNPIPVLDKNSGMLGGGSDAGRIALEKIRMLLKGDDLKAAQTAYGQVKSRPGIRGTSWMHLMDAEIAVANGKTGQAKKSLKRATKGRSKNPHALYARETLLEATPPLGRLEQLRKKLKTPRLQLDLAKAQAQNGKLGEAEANYESLLWSQPGATDPVETVLGWIDLIDRKGESDMARTLAESVQSSRPYDLRAVNQLMELADRNNDEEGAATWATAKIRLKKKARKLKDSRSANPDGTDQATPTANPATTTGAPATPTGGDAGQPGGGTVP